MATRRERIILAITVIVVALYGLDALILTPLGNETAELRQRLDELDAELLSNQNKFRKRKLLSRSWSRWVQSGLSQDPSEAETQILTAVRSWSREAGIDLVSIQPERPAQKGELREIRFHASANGSYGSLIRFLYLLESAVIPVRAQRLDLRPTRGADRGLSLELRFSTLYRVPERSA